MVQHLLFSSSSSSSNTNTYINTYIDITKNIVVNISAQYISNDIIRNSIILIFNLLIKMIQIGEYIKYKDTMKKKIPDIYVVIGDRIKHIRKSIGMTQDKLACLTGYTRTSIVHIENGKQGIPADKLFLIAKCIGANVTELINDIESSNPDIEEEFKDAKKSIYAKGFNDGVNSCLNELKEFSRNIKRMNKS